MNWRRLAWLVILLLVVTAGWASVELKGRYDQIASARTGGSEDVDWQLSSLQRRIAHHRERLEEMEKLALWPSDRDLMSWLTAQADDSDVSIIGVEHLPTEQTSAYQHISVKITVRGDYNPLGGFINRLERSPNAVRIDSFRIRRKEYTPEHITMELSLSCFRKVVESP